MESSMATSPKFFRVATEGATTDGRKIERADIDQMVATYDPATFAARVNVEHVRGIAPDGVFGSYGDILSLKAEDVQLNVGGQMQTRRALFAEIKPLPSLVSLTGAGQKLFTSIEINPNFAGTGKAYLAGIAVTDNPASLGTEMLAFCAGQGAASPLASRKHAEGNLFTAAEPVEMNFADASIPVQDSTGFWASCARCSIFRCRATPGLRPSRNRFRPASPGRQWRGHGGACRWSRYGLRLPRSGGHHPGRAAPGPDGAARKPTAGHGCGLRRASGEAGEHDRAHLHPAPRRDRRRQRGARRLLIA
jgi:hypothetical protein